MKVYKFRSECSLDIISFFRCLADSSYDSIHIHYLEGDSNIPDREVVFSSSLNLSKLIQIAKEAEDCHVIAQTLRPIDKYTGKRNYSI